MDNNENIYSADFLRNIKYASRGGELREKIKS